MASEWSLGSPLTNIKEKRFFDRCNATDPELSGSPLLRAAALGEIDQINRLIDAGESVVQQVGRVGRTALICAIENNRTEAAIYLLNRGADVHQANFIGTNPISFAVIENNWELAKNLLSRGANPNQDNSAGYDANDYGLHLLEDLFGTKAKKTSSGAQ